MNVYMSVFHDCGILIKETKGLNLDCHIWWRIGGVLAKVAGKWRLKPWLVGGKMADQLVFVKQSSAFQE